MKTGFSVASLMASYSIAAMSAAFLAVLHRKPTPQNEAAMKHPKLNMETANSIMFKHTLCRIDCQCVFNDKMHLSFVPSAIKAPVKALSH